MLSSSFYFAQCAQQKENETSNLVLFRYFLLRYLYAESHISGEKTFMACLIRNRKCQMSTKSPMHTDQLSRLQENMNATEQNAIIFRLRKV